MPRGHITGLWEPEFLLFGRGSNTYLPQSNANTFITVIKCSFQDVFVLSLTVKIDLPLQI